ncbi:MAG TPA: hypothetical protein VN852_12835, partial [Candidatus Krumholzibacteria bacterium]|nr:hypothetical protein [Candidatus Krumholzibacteria bacterium]
MMHRRTSVFGFREELVCKYTWSFFDCVICDLLRDLVRCVERNQNYKNDDQMEAEAVTTHSAARDVAIRKSDFKNPSKTFFSQEKIFPANDLKVRSCERGIQKTSRRARRPKYL